MRRKAEFEDGVGPVPTLASNETLVCRVGTCAATFAAGSPEIPTETLKGGVQCPTCEGWAGFWRETPGETVADRWPGSGAFTPMPNDLYEHAADLGLDYIDVAILGAFEIHRRKASDAAWPKYSTIARQMKIGERTVRKRVDQMCERGLLEKKEHRDERNFRTSNRITRDGLTRALAYVAEHKTKDGVPGLEAVLDELASHVRHHVPDRPAPDAAPTGTTCRAEVEAVEVEPGEEELLTEREPLAPGEFLHEVVGGEEAAIFMLAAEFDATEIDKDDEPVGEAMCPYPRHRRSDWQTHGGRWVCGICHPPAALSLVARRAA